MMWYPFQCCSSQEAEDKVALRPGQQKIIAINFVVIELQAVYDIPHPDYVINSVGVTYTSHYLTVKHHCLNLL